MIFHLLFFSRRLPFRTFYSVFIQYVWFGGKRHRETQLDNGKREEWGGLHSTYIRAYWSRGPISGPTGYSISCVAYDITQLDNGKREEWGGLYIRAY